MSRTVLVLLLLASAAFGDPVVTPTGAYMSLGRNEAGHTEFRRERDGAVVVLVPAGPFVKRVYSRDILAEEGFEIDVPALLVDKHEVTNRQVAAFLAAQEGLVVEDGRVRDADGRTLARAHPWGLAVGAGGARVREGLRRHPAVGATGWLALAYARWVGGDLPRGYEWEKAAAGPKGRKFPWGEERPDERRANGWFHGPRRTMPVGSRPDGASPYGILDLAGNVYERAYWVERPQDVERREPPVMLRGGAWVSPHWSNLRCVDRCAQPMDAAEGSVGFRVVVRDPETVGLLEAAIRPALRVLDDTDAAFREAAHRNVPVFLFLAYDTCGQCDRIRALILTDPRFVAYANEHVVVLAGHHEGDGRLSPTEPLEGPSRLYPGCRAERLREVFSEFVRTADPTEIPRVIREFRISPGMFAVVPHRDRVMAPEQLILQPEAVFPKSGDGVETFVARLREAQTRLGRGLTRTEFLAGKPAPETAWKPEAEAGD